MDKIVDKIRKMMAMAEGDAAGGEHERETALKMAMKLMVKHNLTMAQINKADESRVLESFDVMGFTWMKTISNGIAQMLFCNYYSQKISPSKRRHHFIGKPDNAITAKELAAYVIASVNKEAAAAAKRNSGSVSQFMRSFSKGAAAQIYDRCMRLKAEAERESAAAPTMSNGTALVLASLYAQEAEQNGRYIQDQLGVRLVTKKTIQRNTRLDAFQSGKMFGDKVNLNRQLS